MQTLHVKGSNSIISPASVEIFTALHGMQTRCSDENSVSSSLLSVCLSVKRVHCDKTEERSVQTFIPYEGQFYLVF